MPTTVPASENATSFILSSNPRQKKTMSTPELAEHFVQTLSHSDSPNWVQDLWEELPADWQNQFSPNEWLDFLKKNLPALPQNWINWKIDTELLLSQDRFDPRTTLEVLPIEASLRLGLGGETSGKICLIDLDFPLSEDTQASVETLCLFAKTGLSVGMGVVGDTFSTQSSSLNGPGIFYGKRASFVEIEIIHSEKNSDKTTRTFAGKLGIGSAGTEFQLSLDTIQGYQGLGFVGVGGSFSVAPATQK